MVVGSSVVFLSDNEQTLPGLVCLFVCLFVYF